jgi:hypothetical protein
MHEVSVRIPFDVLTSICGQLDQREQAQLRDVLDRSLNSVQEPSGDETLFDVELEAFLAEKADPRITLDQVREALSSIHGSMAQAIIEEREER